MSGNFAIKGGGVGPLMANAILNFHFDFLHPSLIAIALSFLKWVFAQLDEPAVGGRQSFHGLRSELRFFAQSAGQNYLLHLSRIKIMDVICSQNFWTERDSSTTRSRQVINETWTNGAQVDQYLQFCRPALLFTMQLLIWKPILTIKDFSME